MWLSLDVCLAMVTLPESDLACSGGSRSLQPVSIPRKVFETQVSRLVVVHRIEKAAMAVVAYSPYLSSPLSLSILMRGLNFRHFGDSQTNQTHVTHITETSRAPTQCLAKLQVLL